MVTAAHAARPRATAVPPQRPLRPSPRPRTGTPPSWARRSSPTRAPRLPVRVPGLRTACTAVWALSAAAAPALLAARAVHWLHHRDQARAHLLDPAVAPFYGCLAMALLAVGGGALARRARTGSAPSAAVAARRRAVHRRHASSGLAAAVAIPYLMVVTAPSGARAGLARLAAARGRAHGVRRARPAAGAASAGRAGRGRPCCSPASRCSA